MRPFPQTCNQILNLPDADNFVNPQEDPNFHKYLQSEVLNTASDAVLGSPATAAQFQIVSGQLVQNANGTPLYAVVEAQANSTVTKLKMSWSTTPASGDSAGTFMWSGDTVEWQIASINRPQLNVRICRVLSTVLSTNAMVLMLTFCCL